MENNETWLSIKKAADLKSVHPNTIRNCIKDGRLHAERLGARIIRIHRADLDALFTEYKSGEYGIWRGQVGAN
jgi:excisionase family DNA binding protein